MYRGILFGLLVLLAPSLATAGEIAGFWKHADEPGWIEIRLEDGVGKGTVVRNDVYPERVGRELLQALTADKAGGTGWRGQVWVERLGEYRDAELKMPEPDALQIKVKVGFISRTVDWVRVDRVPEI